MGDAADAAVIARGWLEDAFAEHASIASFARFTLDLLALGAPSDLVLGAQRAGLDEVRHARLCFGLAARYSGESVGPGALEIQGALDAPDLGSFAARTVREGCVGETIAALNVAEQARWATDPALRRALEGVARDEANHAELAWRAVRWAVAQGNASVRGAVARAFDEAMRSVAATRSRAEPDLRGHGRLRSVDQDQVKARALIDVVGPCAQALLLG
ncbi:MAG TPA: ferritin-like domain-containing protein [Polyangiaceae bacterium]|nr:ferritin-like domain-containing protein [Polyangiaceae bacterium]